MKNSFRAFAWLWLAGFAGAAVLLSATDSRTGAHDAAFDTIPFQDWTSGPDSNMPLQWSVHTTPAQLSFHQRLVATVLVQVDGAELARRRGKGQFVVFTQFTDSAGASYQNHSVFDLTKVEESLNASNVLYPVRAFVLPGEYRITTLLLASASREHWSRTQKVQFAGLKHDPLPEAWTGLPTVSFVPADGPPDSWFLPGLPERLSLAFHPKTPQVIDVLVNLTPSERQSGSTRFRNETLSALIPTFKVIARMRGDQVTLNAAFLDLSRRRAVFRKNGLREINSDELREAFSESSTNTIDIHSLENRGKDAAFFVKEVSRSVSADVPAGTRHALIILTASTAFEPGEDLRPIEAAPGNGPVFYIRYEAPVVRPVPQFDGRGWGSERGGVRGIGNPGRHAPIEHPQRADELEKTLKPIGPRVFDVSTPEQMRKALAVIREDIESR